VTDVELIEAAAKAIGLEHPLCWEANHAQGEPYAYVKTGDASYWRPLGDDGCALRLAIELGIEVVWPEGVTIAYGDKGEIFTEDHGDDPYAATRRAIVRAAAAMAG